jgi:hypothetical protein
MSDEDVYNDSYRPGETVPISGIWVCNCGQDHRAFESTDVKGHTFPPPPTGCSGHAWHLRSAARSD